MSTISQNVEFLLKQKPFIMEAIADGIINYTGLAQYLKSEIEYLQGKEVKIGAIVMALRRLNGTDNSYFSSKINDFLKKMGDIVVRSDLVTYTFRNSVSLVEKQVLFLKLLSKQTGYFYTVSQGVHETTFVMSDILRSEIADIFMGESLVSFNQNLSSITIKLPFGNTNQPGLYYVIFRKLALANINVKEVVSTSNEFTVLLDDKYIDKAFSVIKSMK